MGGDEEQCVTKKPNFRPVGLTKTPEALAQIILSSSGCCFLLNFASFSLPNFLPLPVIFHTNSHLSLWFVGIILDV